ncbi:hypothetical protein Gobs_1902 [Geodermatophilus obscurus DSM 43160]|uniref:Uncharacterized protein n=1 Tax=Geodermatophilus obscurus (strain ATCC 25078 / DSM 43160 / JCM 3152 / CCUG 61914 / KCC A-0152 / KCTC 9177 / NBRC 13315 / NRRL B-3577 / G-20) TaxID=526225 RepID=D2SED3_GEOOG|nr:hypothetical protein Gobs_1902 [Geodermatophilus obscurus DSM 43160]
MGGRGLQVEVRRGVATLTLGSPADRNTRPARRVPA